MFSLAGFSLLNDRHWVLVTFVWFQRQLNSTYSSGSIPRKLLGFSLSNGIESFSSILVGDCGMAQQKPTRTDTSPCRCPSFSLPQNHTREHQPFQGPNPNQTHHLYEIQNKNQGPNTWQQRQLQWQFPFDVHNCRCKVSGLVLRRFMQLGVDSPFNIQ